MLSKLLKPKNNHLHKVAICCIVKDEDSYFKEWLDYHIKIGVSFFYVYDNGSKIPVAETLRDYIERGLVKVELIEGKGKQMVAYQHCLNTYGTQCKWIAFIDLDEFIVVKTLNGNLPEFLEAYEKYSGLGINWLLFGSNGHIEKPQGLQTHNFTKRMLKTNSINGHIKSIVQPTHVKKVTLDPHHFIFKRGKFCVNENFEFIRRPIIKHTSSKIQLNHYFLRSFEEYKEKLERGRADDGKPRTLDEFHELNKEANLITDESIIEVQIFLDNPDQAQ